MKQDGSCEAVGGTGGGVCVASHEVPPEDCGSESGVCGKVEGFCEVGCEGADGPVAWGWWHGEGVASEKPARKQKGGGG